MTLDKVPQVQNQQINYPFKNHDSSVNPCNIDHRKFGFHDYFMCVFYICIQFACRIVYK